MEENWAKNLAIKALHLFRLEKQAAGNHRQDMSLPVLEDLRDKGYSVVTWDSGHSKHSQCLDMNRQTFELDSFINTSEYDSGIFSRVHPGDENCTLIVSGDNLPDVRVDSYGDTDFNIGTNRPVKIPKEPKVKTKVLAPKPEQKVVEKPIPESKIKYVPKEVHKQIKDPFEKEHLTDLEYLDWLKELEQEQGQESIPVKKELTDDELDEMRNFNKETSKKVPHWITGLFKG